MHPTNGSTEEVARQLAGISCILQSIAEEASVEARAEIERARRVLSGIAQGSLAARSSNCTDAPGFSGLPFDPSAVTTRTFDITGFENVEVDSAFIFEIVASRTYRVSVTTNEGVFENLNVVRSGDTLKLSLKPVRLRNRPVLEARIAMPTIGRLRQSAATKGTLSGFRTDKLFDLYLSGASVLNVDIDAADSKIEVSGASRLTGNLTARKLDLLLSGASRAQLVGLCQTMTLSAWGAADLDLSEFVSQESTVYLKGASHALVNVARHLDVDLTGASSLSYAGNPALGEISLSGASLLIQSNG